MRSSGHEERGPPTGPPGRQGAVHALARGSTVQRLRLVSGLVLFLFAATHLLNHALGLVSLDAMEDVQTIRQWITRSWLGTMLLAAAFLTHVALALLKTAERRTRRMPAWETLQVASGILIPLLLIDHVVTTRFASALYGTSDFYKPVLAWYWPQRALVQTLLVLVVWMHACVGLHFWLRLAPWYRRAAPVLLAAAVLLPALALAGISVAGRQVAASLGPDGGAEALLRSMRWPTGAGRAQLDGIARAGLAVFGALVACVAGVHLARAWRERRAGKVAITYARGPTVEGPLGATLLEISRLRHVPHASVCGGRARCSTCRVRIDVGAHTLSRPLFPEAVTLGAIGAAPGVRLACQIRPEQPLVVTRLVAPEPASPTRGLEAAGEAQGVERTLAIMFLDVRGFTALSERRLPYDVVFLLNRFFKAIGDAIQSEGGAIDKYLGDGLLALFGHQTGAREGCRAALAAAARIDLALEQLNAALAAEHDARLRIGIGLHAGPLVVGRIGHPDTAATTVIGPPVNAAARLEALTKEKRCQLVVSRYLAQMAGWAAEGVPAETTTVRGVAEPIEVLLVAEARTIVLPAP